MQNRMAMIEGAASAILTGKPYRSSVRQQRGKGEGLG
jgi:hypothetical protein